MRTAEQGQAAAPQEREHRRRYLKIRRWHHKKKRKKELAQMRQKDIAFFETLEQMDLKKRKDSYDSSSHLDKH